MAWCGLDADTMALLCTSLPSSVVRLNIAGCRKTITDDSEYKFRILQKLILKFVHSWQYQRHYLSSHFRHKGFSEKLSKHDRIRLE